MGLLGDITPDQWTALGLLGNGISQKNFTGGAVNAMQYLDAAPERRLKQQYTQAQLDNITSEIETRKATLAKQQAMQDAVTKFFGPNGSQPAQMGQLGSGSFGVVPPPAGMSDIPAMRPAGLAGKSIDEISALHALGGPDLLPQYKFAKEGIERKPGSFYEDLQGRRQYIADPTKGYSYENGAVGVLPGFANANAQITASSELPKAILQSAGRVNLRKNADGTESPVPELSENPLLSNMFTQMFGGGQVQPRPMGPATPPGPVATPSNLPVQPRPMGTPAPSNLQRTMQVSPDQQRGADAETLAIMQAELRKPDLPPDQRAGIQREIARIQQAQTQPGFPTPSAIRNPQGYGMTTQQAATAKANEEQAVQQAKDIAEQRKNIRNAGFVAPSNIAKYQQIGRLLADVDGGKYTPAGTEFASALNSFGIKVDKNLPNKEAAASLANQAALELRNPASGAGMPGAMSDSDRQFLSSMTPNMAQSAQGRKMVIDAYVAVQTRNKQVADFASKYEKKYGKLDNGFFDQLSAWSSANPLFKAQ